MCLGTASLQPVPEKIRPEIVIGMDIGTINCLRVSFQRSASKRDLRRPFRIWFPVRFPPPKMREIALWPSTNLSIPEFGRAASGRALAPEPATRHRGRTRVSTHFRQLSPTFFLGSDVSNTKNLRSDNNIGQLCPISDFGWETSDLKKKKQKDGEKNWLKSTWLYHVWCD